MDRLHLYRRVGKLRDALTEVFSAEVRRILLQQAIEKHVAVSRVLVVGDDCPQPMAASMHHLQGGV